jgi:hypothetical protein
MVAVVLVNHSLPLVDSRGDEKAHQEASFYGMSHLPSSNISPLHFLFLFWLVNVCMYDFMHIILVLLYHVYITYIYK